jgi:hypothetical protein
VSGPNILAPAVVARDIFELNAAWAASVGRRALSVGGRYVIRDGVRYCVGGLRWRLQAGDVAMVLVTSVPECDALPDLPVVRAAGSIARPSVTAESAVAA